MDMLIVLLITFAVFGVIVYDNRKLMRGTPEKNIGKKKEQIGSELVFKSKIKFSSSLGIASIFFILGVWQVLWPAKTHSVKLRAILQYIESELGSAAIGVLYLAVAAIFFYLAFCEREKLKTVSL